MCFNDFFLLQQRGRLKEEYFFSKVKEMLIEEEKKRIPVAQGLPWTTDEPEVRDPCYIKITRHSNTLHSVSLGASIAISLNKHSKLQIANCH